MSGERIPWAGRLVRRPPKLLLDINIVLDVILEREEFLEESGMILSLVEYREAEGYVASHTITTAHYLTAKSRDRQTANISISALLGIVQVVPLESADFHQAFQFPMNDYEDAVQVAAALKIGADCLVTRNTRDFKSLPDEMLRVRSPAEVLAIFSSNR